MVSLDPMVLQEHAFLQNFVRRVLDLKPNIFLVERNVACKAQEMLLNGGITLVHNIKPHIMDNISRCTGADILPTMEQITKPRLGTCQSFRIEKFTLPVRLFYLILILLLVFSMLKSHFRKIIYFNN